MKILVPLNLKEHMKDYIDCGAGEFYLGFYDRKWYEQFGEYADINRLTGFKENANPHSYEEVLELIKTKDRNDPKIFITFNAAMYAEEYLPYIREYMRQLKAAGCDGVIVSCIELVEMAKEEGLYCVISTIAGIYNRDIATFYVKHGADRIILPRDLSVDEIETIVHAVPDTEYEVFMMRNGCAFSDSNCLGLHRNEFDSVCSTLCRSEYEVILEEEDFYARHDAEWNHHVFRNEFHNITCGICSIYRFVRLGIAACKIVGRSDEHVNICRDISLIAENIKVAKECSFQEEFLSKMHFPQQRREVCIMGLSCYYPEMRFHEQRRERNANL